LNTYKILRVNICQTKGVKSSDGQLFRPPNAQDEQNRVFVPSRAKAEDKRTRGSGGDRSVKIETLAVNSSIHGKMEDYEDRPQDLYPLVIDDGPVDLGVETTVANLAEEHVGMKHPLEEMEDDFDAKRFKTEEGKKAAQQSTNRQWDAMFERLVVFKQKYGVSFSPRLSKLSEIGVRSQFEFLFSTQHCLVPKRYAEDPKLGTWVSHSIRKMPGCPGCACRTHTEFFGQVETQRVQYKRLQREYDEASGVEAVQPNKRLNQERLRKLQEIGFVWSAKHVKKQRNNSLPSVLSPMEADMPILITAQGPPPSRPRKTETKAARLNDEQWEEMYQRLVRYKEEHGECLVPRKYEADPKLSTWVETQRVSRPVNLSWLLFQYGQLTRFLLFCLHSFCGIETTVTLPLRTW
jgi:hypothetical protein